MVCEHCAAEFFCGQVFVWHIGGSGGCPPEELLENALKACELGTTDQQTRRWVVSVDGGQFGVWFSRTNDWLFHHPGSECLG